VAAVAITADGHAVSSGTHDGTVRVWDLATGTQVTPAFRWLRDFATNRHPVMPPVGGCLSASTRGSRAVSGYSNGTVRVWDLHSGAMRRTLTGHDGPVTAVAISADGRRAISGGKDGTVQVSNPAQGVNLATVPYDSEITALAATPPGTRVIAGTSTGPVHLLELSEKE
jgi:WD40 repeat protein